MFRFSKINRIILTMIYADFIFVIGGGLISPIIAVFITEQVTGGSVAVAGFAVTVFWVVKSAVQIPVSLYADKRKGDRDDYGFILVGYAITTLISFLYFLFVREAWHVYLLEAINGVAYGMLTPCWLAVFTKNIDRQKENTEWMMHSNAVGLGFAAAAAIGGVLAERFGFRVIFLVVGVMKVISTATLFTMRREFINGGDGRDGDGIIEIQRQKEAIQR
ncbi:hypothetical protein AMJ57_01120 [Parcubacteria bacterium SG8_24]|nr:MAG: hypothetical protein AMJ57_01120 [Parcubacteria bacterium SG8_24]